MRVLRDAGAAGAVAIVAAGVYASTAIFRHERFASNAYDLGIFDQTVWGWSRLAPEMDNTVRNTPTVFIDHFQPILALLGPVYWVWSDPRALLVVQAIALAAASVPLAIWARHELGSRAALALQIAYLGFWAVLAGNLFDFHDIALAAPALSVALYGLVERRDGLLVVGSVAAALTREDMALTVAALGLVAAVLGRRRLGGAIFAASIAWFVLAVNIVIPALSGEEFEHWGYYGTGDEQPHARDLITDPVATAERLVTPRDKLVQLGNLFVPWLLLPLGSLLTLVGIPNLLERFLSFKPAHWQQGFHYSLALAPVLAFATADTLRRLPQRWLAALLAALLAAGLFFTVYRMRPLAELRRYPSAERAAEIRECLRAIPDDASVAATSALVPHISQREGIYVYGERRVFPRYDYAALDSSTWTFPLTASDVRSIERSLRSEGFDVVCRGGATVVLRRP
jgi:uncharacterized membrane protein